MATWDTGDLFGKLEGETEYTIGYMGKSLWGSLFGGPGGSGGAQGSPQTQPVDVNSDDSIRRGVSRARSELRIVSRGLEDYSRDSNALPPTLTPYLTSPVAYLRYMPADPFSPDGGLLRYKTKGDDWALWSVGPDRTDNDTEIVYDATNGSVSPGDIVLRKNGKNPASSAERPAESTPTGIRQRRAVQAEGDSEDSVRRRMEQAHGEMQTISKALGIYSIDFQAYPPALDPNLVSPIAYITRIPADPFSSAETPYSYRCEAANSDWMLWSVGPDGTDNGAAVVYDASNGTLSAGDLVFSSAR